MKLFTPTAVAVAILAAAITTTAIPVSESFEIFNPFDPSSNSPAIASFSTEGKFMESAHGEPYAKLTVSGFGAFISNWSDEYHSKARNWDSLSFRVRDTRPEYAVDVACTLPTSVEQPAYADRFMACGTSFPYPYVAFKMSEGELKILRGWRESSYVT